MKEESNASSVQPDSLRGKVEAKLIRVGIALVVAGIIFLLGLLPMWYQARLRAQERDAARHELRLNQLQNSLAAAAIDARRGEYEPARQEASRFFSELRTEVDDKTSSVLTAEQMGKLNPIFAQRDEVVTLLARNDPAAADRLSDMFATYRKVVGSGKAQP